MPWNSTSPIGGVSVKANRPTQQQNTTYIEVTMGNSIVGTNTNTTRDHFWNVGANEDGRHRFIQSPAFTVLTVAADPVIGTGMDGVKYIKTVKGRVEGFYRNAAGIYQYIPSFLQGTVVVGATYTTIVSVPTNVYGEIFMFTNAAGEKSTQSGFFKSNGTICDSTSYAQSSNSGSSSTPNPRFNLVFATGANASGLDIRAQTGVAAAGLTWNYRIIYREI